MIKIKKEFSYEILAIVAIVAIVAVVVLIMNNGSGLTFSASEDGNLAGLATAGIDFEQTFFTGDGECIVETKLLASDAAADDRFGSSVDIEGDYAVIGAYRNNDTGYRSGSAYIFKRDDGGSWSQQAKLLASDAASHDYFGESVSISGDYAVIGAYEKAVVYIFKKEGDDEWVQQARLTPNDAGYEHFGSSVDIDGNYSIMGANYYGSYSEGSAYIFKRDDGGNWVEQAKLLASDTGPGDYFGSSVSISGDYAVTSTYGDDDGLNSGHVYIFEKPDDGWSNMTETAKLTADDAGEQGYFGRSVAIDEDYAVIGAWSWDWGPNSAGSAYIFKRDDGGGWSQQAKLLASDAAYNDRFGASVSISGDYAVIGSYWDDDDGSSSGSVYIFEKPGTGWSDMTETAKLKASDAAAGDYFGSVSISGNYAVIGAYADDDGGSASGSAYILEGLGFVVDECGTCDDDASNDCVQDCAGTWGGSAVVDECGFCDGSGYADNCGTCDDDASNDCVQDCAGTWGGSLVVDECGVCDGSGYTDNCGVCDGDPSNDCVQDCAGTWGGSLVVDECGVCDGSGYADNCGTCDDDASNDCVQDCAGTWGGSAVVDECGTCDDDPSNDCVQDCAGTWGGSAVVDECGTCDDDASNDCVQDCAGEWGGSAVVNECGCSLACPEGTVTEIDNCVFADGSCTGDTWCFDDSGSMTPISCSIPKIDLCSATCPEGTVTEMNNCVFADDSCTGDMWCFDDSGSMTPVSCSDCEGVVDECGVCDGDHSPPCADSIYYNLHSGQNLIGIPLNLGENNNLNSVFSELLPDNLLSITKGGYSSIYTDDGWMGSISTINEKSGYWVWVDEAQEFYITAFEIINPIYDLHIGSNLISFPNKEEISIVDALCEYDNGEIFSVIGEGSTAFYDTNIGWIGSLTVFERGKGYWIQTSQKIDGFQFCE